MPARAGPRGWTECASSATRDERPYTQVQRAGERSIERAFRERTTTSLRGAHEIDKAELHGLDTFVRIAPSQINDGQMGFDPLDLAGGVGIGGGAT